MKLTLGFSPCPNDCFIFDALVHQRIDTEGINFVIEMNDVERLNKKAFASTIDITKLSYHAYAYLTKDYQLLSAGSALGFGCGPLLIANNQYTTAQINNDRFRIAIPGKHTTANLLFSMAFPAATNKVELLFSEIEDAVLTGKVDAGLIIHENRFTYEQKGLKKIIDLGEYWERTTNSPIPLGAIAIKRQLPASLKQQVNRIVRKSVEYAFANPVASSKFVRDHAQEMDEEVMKKHIELYVNKYSIDLGIEGRQAIAQMYAKVLQEGIINDMQTDWFA